MAFDDFYKELIEREKAVMLNKAEDYAKEGNRWANFEEIAALTGKTREDIALTYLLKHIQSITKAVIEGNVEWAWVKSTGGEGLKQRVVDARNYLALLAGMLKENTEKEAKKNDGKNV